MKKEVFLSKLPNDKLVLIPIEQFSERDNSYNPQVCKIIGQDVYGWWIHENTIAGGASDGIGDDVRVRDITEHDIEIILGNGGKCFVEVDSMNILSTPSNIRNKKIVIHFTNEEPVQ